MKRSGFQRGLPQARPHRDRSDEFASFVIERPRVVMASNLGRDVVVSRAGLQKVPERVHQAIRDSARGEDCSVRIVGACSFDPEKTIWSHAPFGAGGKGRGIKAIDLCGAYACTCCDAVIDGQAPLPPGVTREMALIDWFYGHLRSLVRLKQKGLA